MSTPNLAFEQLRDIEQRSRRYARGLPEQLELKATWAAIGFRIGDARLVAPLGIIREILTYPLLSRIPGARPWLKGVANIRGKLTPVTDLGGFLHGEPTPVRVRSRILIVDNGSVGAGLLVDEVLGMRHFFEEEFSADTAMVPAFVQRFVAGVYRQASDVWGSVDLHAIIESDEFMHVAA